MKKSLSYYVKKLEEAGIDTSVFNLEKNGVVLKVEDFVVCDKVVGNYCVSPNSDSLRKYALLFLRMYKATTKNYKKDTDEFGFNAYVRNALSNDYQFQFIKEGFKMNGLARMFFDEIFNENVLFDLVKDYKSRVVRTNISFDHRLKIMNNADNVLHSYTKQELISNLIYFINNYEALSFEITKCAAWKDAYKGFMALCTFQYLKDKGILKTNLDYKDLLLSVNGKYWELYSILENICSDSNVDLKNIDLENCVL